MGSPQVGMSDPVRGDFLAQPLVNTVGGPNTSAVISGRGLNIDFVNHSRADELAVGLTIEGDAAGQAQLARLRQPRDSAQEGKHGLLTRILSRTRQRHVTL